MDGWEFKQYILGFLSYRFISEKLAEYINKAEEEASGEPFCAATGWLAIEGKVVHSSEKKGKKEVEFYALAK